MKTPITFTHCVMDVKEINTEGWKGDRMVARLTFDLHYGKRTHTGMEVEIRQPEGFRFDQPSTDPIEVSPPVGSYPGPFHHESFSQAAEAYYREAFTRFFKISGGGGVSIKNSAMNIGPRTYFIEMPDKPSRPEAWATS